MAMRVIDDTKLQNIAVAIQSKDNGGQMTVDEMAGRIEAIPSGAPIVLNPTLVLWDWEGTKLAAYSREDALALTELPAPDTLPPYAAADHELIIFQSWTWSLVNIKTWIQNHEGETCNVGAIYTTTDRQDHSFWNSPRLDTANTISMQKRGTASIDTNAFQNCYSLGNINIPDGVTHIGTNAFQNCYSLGNINIPKGLTTIDSNAFQNCYSIRRINIPDSLQSIGSGAFNYCSGLKKINLSPELITMGNNAFLYCLSLEEIQLPENIRSISSGTFYACSSLKFVGVPKTLSSINNNAFQYCYSLSRFNIPDTVLSIGNGVFLDCSTLCDILNESKAALSSTNSFSGLPENYKIYVPRDNLSWFETATNWSTIYTEGHIVAIEDYIDYLESIGFNVDKYKVAV